MARIAETLQLDALAYETSRDPETLIRAALPAKYIIVTIIFLVVRPGTRWILVGALGVLGGLLTATAGSSQQQTATPTRARLVVVPSSAFVDQAVDVRLTGLRAKQRVGVSAATSDAAGRVWRSRLVFTATRGGVVRTRWNMKLFWSMRPPKAAEGTALFPPLGPAEVRVRADIDGRTIVANRFVRRAKGSDVTAEIASLSREGFVGTYYRRPPGPAVPGVLQIGGSLGGHSALPAALLASRGYPTLSLAYFKEPGLPPTLKDIPLEYFATALRWLAAQPGVDPRRLVVLGVSRGGEAALLLGTIYPDLVHGVVACTSSATVEPAYPGPGDAWSYAGAPVPLGPIAVERIHGPVLATGGGQDAVSGSARAVEAIVKRARDHGRRDIVGHIYPKAGHSVGCAIPYLPAAAFDLGRKMFLPAGGTQASNALARAASWPRLLHFLATLR